MVLAGSPYVQHGYHGNVINQHLQGKNLVDIKVKSSKINGNQMLICLRSCISQLQRWCKDLLKYWFQNGKPWSLCVYKQPYSLPNWADNPEDFVKMLFTYSVLILVKIWSLVTAVYWAHFSFSLF